MTNKLCMAALCAVGAAFAQTGASQTGAPTEAPPAVKPAPPAFDVASVKPVTAAQAGREGGRGMNMARMGGRGGVIQATPGSVTMYNCTLKNAIRWAYGVSEYQVSGPDWMDSARFDVAAKAAGPAKDDELRLMTRTLLADRFKLALHRQTKEFQVYVLAPAKNGTKLQESTSEGEASIQPQIERMTVTVQHTPISQLIDLLSPIMGAPVLDQTGLKGKYDVTVNIAKYASEMQAGAGGGGPPDPVSMIMTMLEAELGLKLESRKVPLEQLIVDHVERTPTEN